MRSHFVFIGWRDLGDCAKLWGHNGMSMGSNQIYNTYRFMCDLCVLAISKISLVSYLLSVVDSHIDVYHIPVYRYCRYRYRFFLSKVMTSTLTFLILQALVIACHSALSCASIFYQVSHELLFVFLESRLITCILFQTGLGLSHHNEFFVAFLKDPLYQHLKQIARCLITSQLTPIDLLEHTGVLEQFWRRILRSWCLQLLLLLKWAEQIGIFENLRPNFFCKLHLQW